MSACNDDDVSEHDFSVDRQIEARGSTRGGSRRTVGCLRRYFDLAKKGGHLDELRKVHKAALWILFQESLLPWKQYLYMCAVGLH